MKGGTLEDHEAQREYIVVEPDPKRPGRWQARAMIELIEGDHPNLEQARQVAQGFVSMVERCFGRTARVVIDASGDTKAYSRHGAGRT